MKIACVGAGSMAESMIRGWIYKEVLKPEDIFVMNKSDEERLEYLKGEYGVNLVCKDRKVLGEAQVILLAVKPKDVQAALTAAAPFINPDAVIMSVVAGVSISTIQKYAQQLAVARAMPNTSAQIGKSATGVAWSKTVTETQQQEVTELLGSIGTVTAVAEEDLHALTGVAGSGPAYLYYMAEAMTEAAVKNGLKQEDAIQLVRQTFLGAAEMMQTEDFAVLRHNITSPNGTTAAGVAALEERGFKDIVNYCVERASSRSKELGGKFS